MPLRNLSLRRGASQLCARAGRTASPSVLRIGTLEDGLLSAPATMTLLDVSILFIDTLAARAYFPQVWDIKPSLFDKDAPFPSSRPFSQIKHNCQTVSYFGTSSSSYAQCDLI